MSTLGPVDLLGGRGVWACVDTISVFVLPDKAMSVPDFRAILADATRMTHEAGVVATGSISYYGFSTTATHRAVAKEFATETSQRSRHVVLTDSNMMRGSIQVLGWLMPSLKIGAYAPKNWEAASRWISELNPHDTVALGRVLLAAFSRYAISIA